MHRRFLFVITCLGFSLSAAVAQRQPGPAYFLRHPATAPQLGALRPLPAVVPAPPTVAPLPAAAGAPVPTVPRYDLASLMNFPLHVPPPSVPEPVRMYAPSAARDEPMLPAAGRGALGR
ncbi:hypothetical protein GCM10027345_38990 [Hymenobacter daeguensis]